jgi:hypothetical protein
MSRTWRRATPRNEIPISMMAKSYYPKDTSREVVIDEKRIRDGHTIRGCNGSGCCPYCTGNRVYSSIKRTIAADEQMREEVS